VQGARPLPMRPGVVDLGSRFSAGPGPPFASPLFRSSEGADAAARRAGKPRFARLFSLSEIISPKSRKVGPAPEGSPLAGGTRGAGAPLGDLRPARVSPPPFLRLGSTSKLVDPSRSARGRGGAPELSWTRPGGRRDEVTTRVQDNGPEGTGVAPLPLADRQAKRSPPKAALLGLRKGGLSCCTTLSPSVAGRPAPTAQWRCGRRRMLL